MAFRRRFIEQQDLKNHWDALSDVSCFEETEESPKIFPAKHFGNMGYRWDVYAAVEKNDVFNNDMLLFAPRMILEKYKCPVFSRKSFFESKDTLLYNTTGEPGLELLTYLCEFTQYDVDMIWEHIIRTCCLSDIVDALGLVYVLPVNSTIGSDVAQEGPPPATALIIHLYYMDLLEESFHYAGSVPENTDVYITTPKEENIALIEGTFSQLPNKITVRLTENRGRDVSGLLVGCADIIDQYDIICFYHDKKSAHFKSGGSFSYKMGENTLASKDFVKNIMFTFADNHRLGLLFPPAPNHAEFFSVFGNEWGFNFENTKNLAKDLNLRVPISEEKYPVSPLGSVFWFRAKVMKKLFSHGWKYEDFPTEPLGEDGTISHAIERIHSLVAQDAGYYSAYLLSDTFAALEITNLRHYISNFNKILQRHGFYGTNLQIVETLSARLDCLIELEKMKEDNPEKNTEEERDFPIAADGLPAEEENQ
jgi:rhamnosyltransferase